MNRLLIIDGSNLLFQMFFGMPARIVNEKGKAIQGTLGFVGGLLKIIRKVEPTHIFAVFDGEHKNNRQELNPDYKANRIDYNMISEDKNPFSQLKDIYAGFDYLSVKHIETADCEADDLIASYALSYNKYTEIIIVSLDSDFFQLITGTVSVLRYRGEKTIVCTPEYITDRFGITPGQYADFKALTGDTADNIKGAEKVGVKTAAMLLNEFGTLENILANAEQIKKPSVRESIIHNTENLRINYRMIRLDASAPLPFSMQELKYCYNKITTGEVLKGIGLR